MAEDKFIDLDKRLVRLFHEVAEIRPESLAYNPDILQSDFDKLLQNPNLGEIQEIQFLIAAESDRLAKRQVYIDATAQLIRRFVLEIPHVLRECRINEQQLEVIFSNLSKASDDMLQHAVNGSLSVEFLQTVDAEIDATFLASDAERDVVLEHILRLYREDAIAKQQRAELKEIAQGMGIKINSELSPAP